MNDDFKCITEYDEAETFALYGAHKEAKGFAEGYAEGLAEVLAESKRKGRFDILSKLVKDGKISVEIAAGMTGMSDSEFSEKAGLEVR